MRRVARDLRSVARLVACVACAAPVARVAQAQSTAAIAGVVRDTGGRYIVGAEVLIDGFAKKGVTDDSGRFHVDGVPAGKNGFIIRKLTYNPVSFETSLVEGKTLVLQINMQPAEQMLDAAVITASAELQGLTKAGFYERQRQGLGYYITPQKIDSLQYLMAPSQILRDIPGIEVRCGRATVCEVRSRTPPYCMHTFVDGRYEEGRLDELLTTGTVVAFEVYRSPSSIPHEFHLPLQQKTAPGRGLASLTGTAGCGAVVAWTKSKVK